MITNLIPIRIDARSSDGAVRIIDTLLLDTTCLPISHCAPLPAQQPRDGNNVSSVSGGTTSSSGGGGRSRSRSASNDFSLSSLIDANAAYLTESILGDAEVYGACRSSSNTYMGGRMDLLSDDDTKLYREIEGQIRTQLGIALNTKKEDLVSGAGDNGLVVENKTIPIPDGTVSSSAIIAATGEESKTKNTATIPSRIIRIKLRLRQENIAIVDEFDYDVNSSGMEGGCDPFSIARSLVSDLKLPRELTPSIVASIVEQIYGVHVRDSLVGVFGSSEDASRSRDVPTAMALDVRTDGSTMDFAQMIMNS